MDQLHDLTLGDVLREHRRSRPQRTAVVCGDYRATYPDLDQRTNRLANALVDEGIGAGDLVLWLGQNCHRVLECLLGCAKVGAVFVPANWRQTSDELVTLLRDVQPKVVIWQDEEIGSAVRAARADWGGTALWWQHDVAQPDAAPDGASHAAAEGYEAFLTAGSPEDPAVPVDPASPVIQLYTAAFSGRPNGSQLSHDAVLSQALMVALVQRITEDTVYLNSGPMFHMATLMTTFATFHLGGTNVMTRRVDAEELCRLIEAERCNYGFVMGPTAKEIMEVNRDGLYDLTSLRTFGASPAWNEMVQVDDSPWGLHPAGYGQTEATGMLTFNALGIGSSGSSGRPSPWVQVRIVDPDGADVPDGETGEIVARGRVLTNGYHDRDQLNAERTRGGWWHTSDLGRREADGSITFVAPLTRIVKSAAENIYPAEVESCLTRHPGVKEAAIIGVPDPKWTQKVVAVVVRADGVEGEAVTAEVLIAHCRSLIASYKKPSAVEFVDQLPREGWAVDYDALDERFGGGGYPGLGSAVSKI
jgi:acyl-CoA synthetase (AMP-forming)/AMP-acid ligase II